MEEILASIRRIISEDEAPTDAHPEAAPAALQAVEPAADPFAQAEDEEVLELNQPYEPEPEPEAHDEPEFASAMDDIEAAPRPEPEPSYASFDAPPASPASAPARAAWWTNSTAYTVASAFANIGLNVAMPREGRTLEDLVRELMFPLLRDWLNQNLPGIVEAQVRAEVDRLSRLRGAR